MMRHPQAPKSLLAVLAAALGVLGLLYASGAGPASAASSPASGSSTSGAGSAGYWLVGSNGEVYQYGTTNYGDLRHTALNQPVVGGAATDDGLGYWMVASDGGIFSYGDAGFHGSTGGITLNKPIVGMAADPATGGYWLVASDGGIFSYSAPFFGSTGGITLDKPIVGMAATPDGKGYWLVASDGGVFSYGDARFYGSTGGITLDKPIVGMAPTPDGLGYWLVASDGGIFSYGDAVYHGSTGGDHLVSPVVGMSATHDGKGYWLAAADGGVFTFGDAPFLGSAGATASAPIVAMLATDSGFPFPPGGTGYDVSQYQCPDYPYADSGLPSTHPAVAVVQVSGGAIDQYQPSQCYPLEAAWAGANESAYIFMDPMPSPAPSVAMTGPAGDCSTSDVNCQSYNFGWYWARNWVSYARADHTDPTLWWLDVEASGGWSTASADQPSNSQVIAGAVAGLRSSGVTPGLYATHLQWDEITGDDVFFPGIALWVPGAEELNSGSYSATSFCTNPTPDYSPFAGGTTVLVQYGYGTAAHPYDEDYACR